jgi:hypothetical protein
VFRRPIYLKIFIDFALEDLGNWVYWARAFEVYEEDLEWIFFLDEI